MYSAGNSITNLSHPVDREEQNPLVVLESAQVLIQRKLAPEKFCGERSISVDIFSHYGISDRSQRQFDFPSWNSHQTLLYKPIM